jgi:hypothetical protein
LTCAHFLPAGCARDLLQLLAAIDVSTGLLAGIRGRAARRLEKKFPGNADASTCESDAGLRARCNAGADTTSVYA